MPKFKLPRKEIKIAVPDSKVVFPERVIAACPSFTIDEYSLMLTPDSTKIKPQELIAGFLQAGADDVCALLGFGWLYWDYLFLDSVTDNLVSLDCKSNQTQHHSELFVESMRLPQAAKIKKEAQQYERTWLDEHKHLAKYKAKFILSGNLLDNIECQKIYQTLNDYCNSKQGKTLANILAVQTRKFTERHLGKVLARKELVCKYSSETPAELANVYMTEYTRFEFSAFVYLALHGGNTLFTDHVDEQLRKAMGMVMSFFKKQSEYPLQKVMTVRKMEFKLPSQKYIPEPETDTEASDSSPLSRESSGSSSPPDSPQKAKAASGIQKSISEEKLLLSLINRATQDPDAPLEVKMKVVRRLAGTDTTNEQASPIKTESPPRTRSLSGTESSPRTKFFSRTESPPRMGFLSSTESPPSTEPPLRTEQSAPMSWRMRFFVTGAITASALVGYTVAQLNKT